MIGPFSRIALRYVAGFLVAKGLLSGADSDFLSTDPAVAFVVGAGAGVALGFAGEGFSWLATTASFRSVSNERRLNFCRVLDTPFRSSIVSVNQTLAPLDASGAHPGVSEANSAAALLPFLMLKNDIGYGALRRRTGRRADTASKASRNLLLVILLTRRPERRSISLFVVLLKILNVRSSPH